MAKYGLICAATENLGDDIQALAARQFLPRVDFLLDRERLDQEITKEKINVIFNGWYLHSRFFWRNRGERFGWPPAPNLNPLFVSFHATRERDAHLYLINMETAGYFRRFAPIGCRSADTLSLFQKYGIDSYLSYCLTLALERPDVGQEKKQVVFNEPFVEYGTVKNEEREKRMWKEIPPEILRDAVYTTHQTDKQESFPARLKKAEELLKIYAGARVVVTSRLHCALPCLAFGTPVIFINSAFDRYRTRDYLPLMRNCTLEQWEKDGVAKKINWDKPEGNNCELSVIVGALRKKCEDFVAACEAEKD